MNDYDRIQQAKRELMMTLAIWSSVALFILMLAAFVWLYIKVL